MARREGLAGPSVCQASAVSSGLGDVLTDWTDWDVAAWELARVLGVPVAEPFWRAKGTFWTDNAFGNGLHDALLALHRAGVLDRRDEPDEQFRWQIYRQDS